MKISGIYKITNKTNGKYYVGGSIDLFGGAGREGRMKRHRKQLNKRIHANQHLQNAWNKNGEKNFDFVVVETVKRNRVLETEQKYLDIAKGEKDKCYNIIFTASICNLKDIPSWRKQLSEAGKKKIFTPTHKENISKAKKGQGIDKTIYQWYNTKTNEKLAGTMFDWYSKHCRAKAKYKWAKRLVSGERPTYRSWVILQ